MGWWASGPDGASFALWGDAPADLVDECLIEIKNAFETEIGRAPTYNELIAGLLFSLRVWMPDQEDGLEGTPVALSTPPSRQGPHR